MTETAETFIPGIHKVLIVPKSIKSFRSPGESGFQMNLYLCEGPSAGQTINVRLYKAGTSVLAAGRDTKVYNKWKFAVDASGAEPFREMFDIGRKTAELCGVYLRLGYRTGPKGEEELCIGKFIAATGMCALSWLEDMDDKAEGYNSRVERQWADIVSAVRPLSVGSRSFYGQNPSEPQG